MNNSPVDIIPITKARSILGELAENVNGENYVILTKGGSPKAALVDPIYLKNLQKTIEKIYGKTYIDSKLLPFTREFSDEEIQTWQSEDKLS